MGMTGARNSRRAGTSRFALIKLTSPAARQLCLHSRVPTSAGLPTPLGPASSSRWAWPFPVRAGTPLSRSPIPHSSLDLQQRSRKIAQSLVTPRNGLRTVRRRQVPRGTLLEPGAHQHLPNQRTLSLWPSASVPDGARPVLFKIFTSESLNADTRINDHQIM